MATKKRKPVSRPPVKTSPPPRGALLKQISSNMKRIRPPGGRKR